MVCTCTIQWDGRDIRLSYTPRRWTVIDHVTIEAADRLPIPVSATGYLSHFFGPVEPQMTMDEVTAMVIEWLDTEAARPEWQAHVEQSKQLDLF